MSRRSPIFDQTNLKPGETVSSKSAPIKINPNFIFSDLTTPQVSCHYHPNMRILNFCMKQECLMPLCAACIEVHQEEHVTKGTAGKFELLEHSLTWAYKSISTECNSFVDDMSEINKFLFEIENRNKIFKNQVQEAKQRIYQVVEQFFMSMEQSMGEIHEKNIDEVHKEAYAIQQSTQKRWETLVGMLEKLNSEKCLKSLIKYHSKDVVKQCSAYHHHIIESLNVNRSQVASFNLDQSALHEINNILQRFVKVNIPSKSPQVRVPLRQMGTQPMQMNTQPMQLNTQPMQMNIQPMQMNTQPLQYRINQSPQNLMPNNKTLPPSYITLAQQQHLMHNQNQNRPPNYSGTPQKLGQVIPMNRQIPLYQAQVPQIPPQFQYQQMYSPDVPSLRSPRQRTPSPRWDSAKYSPRIELS